MRRTGRKPLTNRNSYRASTRALAQRAFATRGRVCVTEYNRGADVPFNQRPDFPTLPPTTVSYVDNVLWTTKGGTFPSVTVGNLGFPNNVFVELCPGIGGVSYRPSAIFNAYTGTGSDQPYGINEDMNYFRVLRHTAYLRLRILPNNVRSLSPDDPVAPPTTFYRPVLTQLPQKLLVRIVGVRVLVDGDKTETTTNDAPVEQGYMPVYLPAYQTVNNVANTNVSTLVTDVNKDLLVPTDTLGCAGPTDFINARFADFADTSNEKRTRGVKLIYDKKFSLSYPYEYNPTESTNGSNLVNLSRSRSSDWMYRIKIDFPPHVVKLLNLTQPFLNQHYRQYQYKFFMCVRQVGLSTRFDYNDLLPPPVSISVEARSKTYYTIPSVGTTNLA